MCCSRAGGGLECSSGFDEHIRRNGIAPYARLRLGTSEALRQENYRTLFKAHIDPQVHADLQRSTNGNYVFGSDRFREEVERMLERRASPGKPVRPATSR